MSSRIYLKAIKLRNDEAICFKGTIKGREGLFLIKELK